MGGRLLMGSTGTPIGTPIDFGTADGNGERPLMGTVAVPAPTAGVAAGGAATDRLLIGSTEGVTIELLPLLGSTATAGLDRGRRLLIGATVGVTTEARALVGTGVITDARAFTGEEPATGVVTEGLALTGATGVGVGVVIDFLELNGRAGETAAVVAVAGGATGFLEINGRTGEAAVGVAAVGVATGFLEINGSAGEAAAGEAALAEASVLAPRFLTPGLGVATAR